MQEMLRTLNDLYAARRSRVDASLGHIPAVVWYVILIVGAMTVGFTYLLGVENLWSHLIASEGLALALVLVIALIVQFDYPFRGTISVGPDAYEKVLANMHRLHPEVFGGQTACIVRRRCRCMISAVVTEDLRRRQRPGAIFRDVGSCSIWSWRAPRLGSGPVRMETSATDLIPHVAGEQSPVGGTFCHGADTFGGRAHVGWDATCPEITDNRRTSSGALAFIPLGRVIFIRFQGLAGGAKGS